MRGFRGPRAGRPWAWLMLVPVAVAVALAEGPRHRPPLDGFERLGTVKARRSTEIADSYWGIQAGSLDDRVLEAAAGIGVKWTRLQASWPAIEKARGTYDFSVTDQAFDATLERGITPFVDLVGANSLYTPVIRYEDRKQAEIYGERPGPPTHNAEAMAAWLRFVEATVTRYRDRIRYWEIWNEPNHRAYWGAPPDAREYGRLLQATATLIRKLAPDAKIVAGATAGMDAPFIDGFLSGSNAALVDVVSYHQYQGEPEARMMRMVKVREVLDRHKPAIETWQGECGYPSASSTRDFRGRAPWGLNIQAKWLLRQAYSDVLLAPVARPGYLPALARVRLSITGVRFVEPVLIDLLSGEVFAIRDVAREGETVVFNNLPLADYPFAIAERGEIGVDPLVPGGPRYRTRVFERVDVRENVTFRRIEGAGDTPLDLRLDVYEPAGDAERARPAIMWIHGGGFRPGNDKRQNYIVRMATDFARRGYVSFSIDYRVRENPTNDLEGTVRDAVEDARAALEWIRRHSADYRIDPQWIAVGGGSAGGVTAVNLAALENAEAARTGRRGVFAAIDLWGSPSLSQTVAPLQASFPPTVIVHGTKDTTIPFALSEELAATLKARLSDKHRKPKTRLTVPARRGSSSSRCGRS